MEDVTCTRNLFEATEMASNRCGLRLQGAVPNRSTVQHSESLLSNVEACGGIDGGEINKPVRLRFGQLPALGAVGGVKMDVECATEEWEVGETIEVRVFRGEV